MNNAFKTIATGLFLGIGSGPALAQDIPTFDCKAGIEMLAGDNGKIMTGIDEQPVTLLVSNRLRTEIGDPNDPVSLIENWDRDGPIVAGSAQAMLDGTTLSCAFMLAEFRVGESQQADEIGHLITDTKERAARYPIFLLQKVNTSETHDRFLSGWRNSAYRIGVSFKPISSAGRTLAEASTFTKADFLGSDWRGSRGKVNHVSFDMDVFMNRVASDELRARLEPYKDVGQVTRGAIILCEPACEIFAGLSVDASGNGQPIAQDKATGGNFGRSDSRAAIDEAVEGIISPPPKPIDGGAVTFGLFSENSNGKLSAIDVDRFGKDGLACLVRGMTQPATIFTSEPDCTAGMLDLIARDAALVEIDTDGNWILKKGAALVEPDSIAVKLPAGGNPSQCTLDFVYQSRSGQVRTVFLDPVSGAQGLFSGHFADPVAQQNGTVSGTIKVNDVAACGSGDQTVTLPAALVLDLKLGGDTGGGRGIAYLFAQNASELEDKIGPFSSQADQVARPIVTALGDAHDRMTADYGDKPWLLTSASLDKGGPASPLPLIDLKAEVLRDKVGQRLKEGIIDSGALHSIADTRLPNRVDDILRQLSVLAENASDSGLQRLDIVMIGVLAANPTDVLPDTCGDKIYDRIADSVSKIDELEVVLHLFPLLKLKAGQDGVLPNMRPMALSASAPSGLGGPYACASAQDHLRVYPFVVESWRSAEPAMARYGVALGDQVYSVLEDIVK